MTSAEPANVVIVGAGIIGVATAYHLSLLAPSTTIHLLDSSPTLFASASGKAAGFLARDWFSPPTASLGALSFDLHRKLAEQHDAGRAWGYSPSSAYSIPEAAVQASRGEDWLFDGTSRALMAGAKGRESPLPAWLAVGRTGGAIEALSAGDSTAQVDPLLLSQFLLGECEARNVHVHHPVTATKVVADAGTNTLTGLTVRAADGTESTLPCDALLLTAGVWTPRVFSALFPRSRRALPITQLSGYSLVLRSPRWIKDSHMLPSPTGCHAAFTTDAAAGFAPEIFSRAGGDIYLAGLNTTAVPVPELATDVHPDDEAIAALAEVAKKLLGDDELDVVKTGLCHRPVTRSGAPLLARLAGDDTGLDGEGVWVCAGHGPWGISMSLGTGLVLAELALGREPSADVSRLGL